MTGNFYVDDSGYYIKNSYQSYIEQENKVIEESFKNLYNIKDYD